MTRFYYFTLGSSFYLFPHYQFFYSLYCSLEESFQNVELLAPAQFVLPVKNDNTSDSVNIVFNVTQNASGSSSHDQTSDSGMFLCALLPLQPMNHSIDWDVRSCQVHRINSSLFHCLCSLRGTTLLIYATPNEDPVGMAHQPRWDFRILLVWLAAAGSFLVLIIALMILMARWYRRRTLLAYLRIQLGLCLVPLTSAYLMPSDVIKETLWTILLTAATYQYLSTLLVMSVYLKSCAKKSSDPPSGSLKRIARFVGFSFGVSFLLSGLHSLLEALSHDAHYVSWLAEFRSVSGILFFLAYSGLMLVLIALYASGRSHALPAGRSKFEKLRRSSSTDGREKIVDASRPSSTDKEQCCLLLGLLSLPVTGSMLVDQHFAHGKWDDNDNLLDWPSLGVHSAAYLVHFSSVIAWAVVVLGYSGDGFVCCLCFWRWKGKPPANSETVTEMLNATALAESPQHQSPLLPDSAGNEHKISNLMT